MCIFAVKAVSKKATPGPVFLLVSPDMESLEIWQYKHPSPFIPQLQKDHLRANSRP